MAWILLIAALAALSWFLRNDRRAFARFAQIADTRTRQRKFLRWAVTACSMYLGMPLAGLALMGRLDALAELPEEFWPVAIEVPFIDAASMAGGAAIGAVLGAALLALLARRRRGRPAKPSPRLDITPLLPRNRAEMLCVLPLIVNAAISEEIFFRVYLPLLLVLAGANGWLAFAVSGLLFGALHRYQGWLGMAITALMSVAFAWLYLGSGGLMLPVIFHLLINLNALLLRPAINRRFGRSAD